MEKITQLCDQIILAANTTSVHGEQNMAQLLGICRAARAIKATITELSAKQEEVNLNGG